MHGHGQEFGALFLQALEGGVEFLDASEGDGEIARGAAEAELGGVAEGGGLHRLAEQAAVRSLSESDEAAGRGSGLVAAARAEGDCMSPSRPRPRRGLARAEGAERWLTSSTRAGVVAAMAACCSARRAASAAMSAAVILSRSVAERPGFSVAGVRSVKARVAKAPAAAAQAEMPRRSAAPSGARASFAMRRASAAKIAAAARAGFRAGVGISVGRA